MLTKGKNLMLFNILERTTLNRALPRPEQNLAPPSFLPGEAAEFASVVKIALPPIL
jgi:hypothetical protein